MIYYIELLEGNNIDDVEVIKRARKLKSFSFLVINSKKDLEVNYSKVIIELEREIKIYSLSLFFKR